MTNSPTPCLRRRPVQLGALVLIAALTASAPSAGASSTEEFLSTGEVAAVTGGAVVSVALGQFLGRVDTSRAPLIKGPLPFEEALQRGFGGECRLGKRNFLDDTKGGMYTPAGAGLLLLSADLAWPRADRGKETAQDIFLYGMGLFTTKGLTSITKAIVRRPRPLLCLEPDLADQRENPNYGFDRSSFFSGHTSSAFFSCAFLNLRLRDIMRRELSTDDYRTYRWAPPTFLFSWAAVVGWSRVHAYRHYVSDVVVGAVVGALMADLFYDIGEDTNSPTSDSGASPMLISFRYTF